MGVEEGDDLALDLLGADEARTDQAGALAGAQDAYRHRQRLDVLLELFAQVICVEATETTSSTSATATRNRDAPRSLASSTRMISATSSRGDRTMMVHTVRNSVDQASLWNTMTMLVVGSSSG